MPNSKSQLFAPLRIGDLTLSHRIVMAPMTRMRATSDYVLEDVSREYYAQRSTVPGTLLISEAVGIAAECAAFPNIPAIFTSEQIASWKKISDAVHANGAYLYLQIIAAGRIAYPEFIHAQGFPYVSSYPTQHPKRPEVPVALSEAGVERYIAHFAQAARNAIEEAGCDGVEIHACNGSLIEQFIQDVVNKRTDKYGGSIENRARFLLEVTDAVVKAIGEKRTGIRLSPWSKGQGKQLLFDCMGMRNPIPTYTYIISELVKRHSDLAYIHMIEPGIEGIIEGAPQTLEEGIIFASQLWSPRVYMTGGGYTPESALKTADKYENTAVAIGRMFISNPDLPSRICAGHELAASDPSTYYSFGPTATRGYIDYPLASSA
ncbi:FMN-linked oxidoreductase [Ceratobasidium sp. AG-I]|nr:FMN-linked oxidoreductase [Ceratobasidium sp. AG-I]